MADFEVHAVGTAERLRAGAPAVAVSAHERDRWMARALRAEGILAAIWRRLDDFRERGQAMPGYAEMVRLFVGPIASGAKVLHRCDTPSCVNPAHLFAGTDADNAADRERKGRGRRVAGEASPHAKLTEADVRRIKCLLAAGVTHRKIAKQFGVGSARIGDIARGATWRHV